MKTTHLKIKECVHIDEELQDGVLYVSRKYEIAIHLCACGCKTQTVTPIATVAGVSGWSLTEGPNGPTLRPSIGNQQFPCKSHYWVTDGAIVWC